MNVPLARLIGISVAITATSCVKQEQRVEYSYRITRTSTPSTQVHATMVEPRKSSDWVGRYELDGPQRGYVDGYYLLGEDGSFVARLTSRSQMPTTSDEGPQFVTSTDRLEGEYSVEGMTVVFKSGSNSWSAERRESVLSFKGIRFVRVK